MHATAKTFYGIGIVAAALNAVGAVLLLLHISATLLFNLATIAGGSMMLLLGATTQNKQLKPLSLGATLLMVLSLVPGVIGKIGGALAWPLFAFYFYRANAEESTSKTAAGIVLLAGAVQLAGSFLPLPATLRICLAIFIAAAQGVLAWVLFHSEAA